MNSPSGAVQAASQPCHAADTPRRDFPESSQAYHSMGNTRNTPCWRVSEARHVARAARAQRRLRIWYQARVAKNRNVLSVYVANRMMETGKVARRISASRLFCG